eukprot:2879274-Rhodomonas_salina.4
MASGRDGRQTDKPTESGPITPMRSPLSFHSFAAPCVSFPGCERARAFNFRVAPPAHIPERDPDAGRSIPQLSKTSMR